MIRSIRIQRPRNLTQINDPSNHRRLNAVGWHKVIEVRASLDGEDHYLLDEEFGLPAFVIERDSTLENKQDPEYIEVSELDMA